MRVWSLTYGETTQVLTGHTKRVKLSSDDSYLVSGGEDNSVRIWDLSTGRETQILESHTGKVSSVNLKDD